MFYVRNPLIKEKETESFKRIGSWNPTTFSTKEWKEIKNYITNKVKEVGVYEISFKPFMQLKNNLDFQNWKVNIYGREDSSLIKFKNNRFYITRSQQTLDEFKTIFSVKIQSQQQKIIGNILIRRLTFD